MSSSTSSTNRDEPTAGDAARPEFDPRPVVLENAVIRLEPLAAEHAPGVLAAGKDASTFSHLPDGPFADLAEARAWIERALAASDRYGNVPFATIDLRGPEPVLVGSTRLLHVRRKDRGLEIGWTWLAPAVRGTGLNTAVKHRLLAHCFDELGAVRVGFKTDARNVQSRRALSAIGAVEEGTLRKHRVRRDGTYRDSVYFSIIDVEWPAIREELGARVAAMARSVQAG